MEEKLNQINVANAPKIRGLSFRHFRGEDDYPDMIAVWTALRNKGFHEGSYTVDDLALDYRHLSHCDPYKDLIIAEIDGKMTAYGRVWWEQEASAKVFYNFINILPELKGSGIEEALLNWMEARLLEISGDVPGDDERWYDQTISLTDQTLYDVLTNARYEPKRYFFSMSRDLEVIPQANLPEGIHVQPAMPSQYHEAWERAEEAFSEHYGYVRGREEDYQSYSQSRWFQPTLWQLAWDGDRIVGQVQNFIDSIENEANHRFRGYTEAISVLKPWRGRGIARALIVRSMHMMKAMNMTEVALTVDSENATGALGLYESLGYKTYRTMVDMRKPLPAVKG